MRLGPFDISEVGLRRLRRDLGVAAIPIVLGVATLIVGGISWGIFVADPKHLDTAPPPFHSDKTGPLHTFVYGALRTVSDFAPSVWNVNEGNWGTDVAAILGAAAFYASVFLVAANVLSETIRRFAVRVLYRDHVVIIGQTSLASRLESVWKKRARYIVQVVAKGGGRPPRSRAQVRSEMDKRIFDRFALARASAVFIDLGDDMATLSLAYSLVLRSIASDRPLKVRPSEAKRGKGAEWTLVVRDRMLADHFAERLASNKKFKPPAIRYFAPERAVVRHFMSGHPLFLVDGCRNGIHALVIGSGAAVDELIQAIFQTALIFGVDRPRVTIVCGDPAKDRSAFFSRRPGLVGDVDVEFLALAALDDFEPVARVPAAAASAAKWDRTLHDRDLSVPVTVIFLMNESADANSRFAIKLKSVQEKTGRLRGKLFGGNMNIGEDPGPSAPKAFGRKIRDFETFALDDRFLDQELCTTTRRQTLAVALNENYRDEEIAKNKNNAEKPPPPATWEGLSESLRRANEDAADHCLAKLHMLGFDVSRVPPGAIPRLREADDATLRTALRAEPLEGAVHDVVFLEHDRWMLERRFDGWVYGPTRDNPKKIHPLLVPWDQLGKAEQDKDRDQIEALLKCLRTNRAAAVELERAQR